MMTARTHKAFLLTALALLGAALLTVCTQLFVLRWQVSQIDTVILAFMNVDHARTEHLRQDLAATCRGFGFVYDDRELEVRRNGPNLHVSLTVAKTVRLLGVFPYSTRFHLTHTMTIF